MSVFESANEGAVLLLPCITSTGAVQTDITATVPLPEGKTATKLLQSYGRLRVEKTEVTEDNVFVYGKLIISAILSDGELYSFTATAEFSETVETPGANIGDKASVQAELLDYNAILSGNAIQITGTADIQVRTEKTVEVLTIADKIHEDAEIKYRIIEYSKKELIGSQTIRLREEMMASDVMGVIQSDGTAIIRDIQMTKDNARIDGILSIAALCSNSDMELFQLSQSLPFTADIAVDDVIGSSVAGSVEAKSVSLRCMGEEFGLITVETELYIELYLQTPVQQRIITEAFVPGYTAECNTSEVSLLLYKGRNEQRSVFKGSIKNPDNGEAVKKAIYVKVNPVITEAISKENTVSLDGIAFVQLIYLDEKNTLRSLSDELPFGMELSIEKRDIELDAVIHCQNAAVMGINTDGVEISYTLYAVSGIYEHTDVSVLSDMELTEAKKVKSGFFVCYTEEGETAYDIAKRFGVPQSALNVSKTGDRITVLV